MTITRYAYINTRSAAGRPTKVWIEPSDAIDVRCWFNSYGNPSYTFRLKGGFILFMVDDYGAENGIRHVRRTVVPRKHDLFNGWLP